MKNMIIVKNRNEKVELVRNYFRKMATVLTVISLFAGCGGSSDGYHQAGLNELLAIEWDKHARQCFSLNFPRVPVFDWNISEITGADIMREANILPGQLDVFDASPPCQSLSRANTHAKADDDRGMLFLKTVNLIGEVQPKVFLIENVLGLIQGKNKAFFNRVIGELEKMDYYCEYKVLNAEEYNVPSARRRVIIVGVRGDIYRKFGAFKLFPDPDLETAKKMRLCDILPNVVAFSPGQFKDKIIASNVPVCTITKTASLWFYEKDGVRRKPTIEELMKLSSFRSDFQFLGSFLQKWARIGNAVPPNLIKALALNLKHNVLTKEVLEYADSSEALQYAEEMAYRAVEINNGRCIDLRKIAA